MVLGGKLVAFLLAYDEVKVLVIKALIFCSCSRSSMIILAHRNVRFFYILTASSIQHYFRHCYRSCCCRTDPTDRISMHKSLLREPDRIQRDRVVLRQLRHVLLAIICAVHLGTICRVALTVTLFALLQKDGGRGHVLNLDLLSSLCRL